MTVGKFIAESCKQSAAAGVGRIQVLHGEAVVRLVLKPSIRAIAETGKFLNLPEEDMAKYWVHVKHADHGRTGGRMGRF